MRKTSHRLSSANREDACLGFRQKHMKLMLILTALHFPLGNTTLLQSPVASLWLLQYQNK